MPKVICNLPNASETISGVAFKPHPDGGVISEDLPLEVVEQFLAIPGYVTEHVVDNTAELEARAQAERQVAAEADAASAAAAAAAAKKAADDVAAASKAEADAVEAAKNAEKPGEQDDADAKNPDALSANAADAKKQDDSTGTPDAAALEIDALRIEAASIGIVFKPTWKAERLKAEIKSKKSEAA